MFLTHLAAITTRQRENKSSGHLKIARFQQLDSIYYYYYYLNEISENLAIDPCLQENGLQDTRQSLIGRLASVYFIVYKPQHAKKSA